MKLLFLFLTFSVLAQTKNKFKDCQPDKTLSELFQTQEIQIILQEIKYVNANKSQSYDQGQAILELKQISQNVTEFSNGRVFKITYIDDYFAPNFQRLMTKNDKSIQAIRIPSDVNYADSRNYIGPYLKPKVIGQLNQLLKNEVVFKCKKRTKVKG